MGRPPPRSVTAALCVQTRESIQVVGHTTAVEVQFCSASEMGKSLRQKGFASFSPRPL
jgi:hypothetical protein